MISFFWVYSINFFLTDYMYLCLFIIAFYLLLMLHSYLLPFERRRTALRNNNEEYNDGNVNEKGKTTIVLRLRI